MWYDSASFMSRNFANILFNDNNKRKISWEQEVVGSWEEMITLSLRTVKALFQLYLSLNLFELGLYSHIVHLRWIDSFSYYVIYFYSPDIAEPSPLP